MWSYLYQFFYNTVFKYISSSGQQGASYLKFMEAQVNFGGVTFTMQEYLSNLCTLISLIFIVVLCCLFVYKIIKLIGGLIR